MFNWLSTTEARKFGESLATFVFSELKDGARKRGARFDARTDKVLARGEERIRAFRATERMNFYKKGTAANAFLWTLKDQGCPPELANELTDWLSVRL